MGANIKSVTRSIRVAWNHPANRDRRVGGVSRLLRFWVASRVDGGTARVMERSGIRVIVRPGHYASTKIVYGFPPDYDEMRFWQRFLRPGDRFVDVGANVGLYSLWAASLGAVVDAYEPSSDSWSDLNDNIALNGAQVEAHKVAVGEHSGEVALSQGLDTMNSVRDGDLGQSGAATELVPMVRLDAQFRGSIRGLKIDVEGYEFEVLMGAGELVQCQEVDLIQFEWNQLGQERRSRAGRDPLSLLVAAGYRLIRLDGARWVELDTGAQAGSDIFAISGKVWDSSLGA